MLIRWGLLIIILSTDYFKLLFMLFIGDEA